MDKKLDADFFEIVIIYNLLTDPQYLGSTVGVLQPRFFKDKSITAVVNIIYDFFEERGEAPTITEVKSHLDTDDLRNTFRKVVARFNDIDQRFNKDELYENTEQFL